MRIPFSHRIQARDGQSVHIGGLRGAIARRIAAALALIVCLAPAVSWSGAFDQAERYENGESVRRDYHRALALYCTAAAAGDARAYLAIAWLYMNGRGVARDDRTAIFWLRKAAAANVRQAVNLIHLMPQLPAAERGCTAPSPGASGFAPPSAYREAIDEAAKDAGISAKLLAAVVSVESGGDARAVSPRGAMGLTQLMPETAAHFHVEDAFDYRENLRGGAQYMRLLLTLYGNDVKLALGAYNAGAGSVAAHGGVPPYRETQAFVDRVMHLADLP